MAEFSHYRCWELGPIRKVMDTEALQTPKHYFFATHSDVRMVPRKGFPEGSTVTQEQFLKSFLDENRDHMHARIIGSAGSGKSHFVNWLFNAIEETPQRKVLLIPKSGTNLRRILDSILEGMEGAQFDLYRARLQLATADLIADREAARRAFLNNLAFAVRCDSIDLPLPDKSTSENEEFKEYLEALLLDASFRRFFLDRTSIIDDLVSHSLGRANEVVRIRVERQDRFTAEHFDVQNWGLEKASLTSDARMILDLLRSPRTGAIYVNAVVSWLNHSLPQALQVFLNLGHDDLRDMMLLVREELESQGRELVLLVEEYAKLQGIDTALLTALTDRRNEGGRRLCVLRSAIAVTENYIDNERDTLIDRTDLIVNLDLPDQGSSAVFTPKDLLRFTSRYLNAVRSPEAEFIAWADGEFPEVPNRCSNCIFRPECHRAFGSVKFDSTEASVGLYPFNQNALLRMLRDVEERRMTGQGSEAFNPRLLLNHVLRHVLETYSQEFDDGTFPSSAVATAFHSRPPAVQEALLEKRVGPNQLGRYSAVVGLWGERDDLGRLPATLLRAFGLDNSLDGSSQALEPIDAPAPITSEPPAGESLPPRVEALLHDIEKWVDGETILEPTLRGIRNSLFPFLAEAIDWDGERLSKTVYCGQSRPLNSLSINMAGQRLQKGNALVSFALPLSSMTQKETALALEGLLKFGHYGNWQFKEGGLHYRKLRKLIDLLANDALTQIRRKSRRDGNFRILRAAVETLMIGSRMCEVSTDASAGIEARLEAILTKPSLPAANQRARRTSDWSKLQDQYLEAWEKISEIVLSQIGCLKGGVGTPQLIDVVPILTALANASQVSFPNEPIPEGLDRGFLQPLTKYRYALDRLLPKAMESEAARWTEMNETLSETLPEPLVRAEVARTAKEFLDAAYDKGYLRKYDVDQALNVVSAFLSKTTKESLEALKLGALAESPGRRLAHLGKETDVAKAEAAYDMVVELKEHLASVESKIASKRASRIETTQGTAELYTELGENLTRLATAATALERNYD